MLPWRRGRRRAEVRRHRGGRGSLSGGGTDDCEARGDIAGHDGTGADDGGVANGKIGKDARPQANEGVCADGDSAAEDGPGSEVRVGADAALVLDNGGGVDDGVIADDREGMDNGCGTDEDALTERRGSVNDGGGVDDGSREAARSRQESAEQVPTKGEVSEGEHGWRGFPGGEERVEIAEPWDAEEPSGDRIGMVVVKPDDAEAREGGGLGDDEGVTAPAQHDDRIGHGVTIGRAAGVGCN